MGMVINENQVQEIIRDYSELELISGAWTMTFDMPEGVTLNQLRLAIFDDDVWEGLTTAQKADAMRATIRMILYLMLQAE
jgi:hypothetical protein